MQPKRLRWWDHSSIWKSHLNSAAFIKRGWEPHFENCDFMPKSQSSTAVCHGEVHSLEPVRCIKCCYAILSPDLLHVLHWNLLDTWWTLHRGVLWPATVRENLWSVLTSHITPWWTLPDCVETFLSEPRCNTSIQYPGSGTLCCIRQQDNDFIMRSSEIFIKTAPLHVFQLGTGGLWESWRWG